MTEQDVIDRLKAAVKAAGGHRKFGERFEFSAGYVNDVIHRRRLLSDRILNCIDVSRKIVYEDRAIHG